MKVGIMQPYFFPYVGYFQLIDAVDVFMMYDLVTFRKRTWLTKNRILDKGKGEPIAIQIPVLNKSSFKTINQIEISEDPKWRIKVLKLIYFNYKKAPFFDEVYHLIEDCVNSKESSLNKYNAYGVSKICDYLEIKTPIVTNSDSFLDLEAKLPNLVVDSAEIKSKRIVEICKKIKANTYINPIGGIDLYKKEYFNRNNLELKFIETGAFTYSQFKKTEVPYLSIIDLLMHNGKEASKQIIKNYKLI